MRTPRTSTDATELSNPSDRAIVLDGIKFQAEYFEDPAQVQQGLSCDPAPTELNFMLRVWEAIILIPTLQGGTNIPAYLPNLTNPVFQGGDAADRVLWKRITYVPIFAFNSITLEQQLEGTMRDTAAGPQVVKSRCRIDDRHALYFVRNFVHDVAIINTPAQPCNFSEQCIIPLLHDSWFKLFYHMSK